MTRQQLKACGCKDNCAVYWCNALQIESAFRGEIALFNYSCYFPVNIVGKPDTIKVALEILKNNPNDISMIMAEYTTRNPVKSPFIALVRPGATLGSVGKEPQLLAKVEGDEFYLC